MTEAEIYQKGAAQAFGQAVNAEELLRENLRRLAACKVRTVLENCLGREYIIPKRGTSVMASAVGFEIADDITNFDRYSSYAIRIGIAFIADVEPMISDKKLTPAEVKLLKELKARRNDGKKKVYLNWYSHGDYKSANEAFRRIKRINGDLNSLKNNLDVIDIRCYEWDLSQVFDPDFMTRWTDYNGARI